jgi:hypothetical protein
MDEEPRHDADWTVLDTESDRRAVDLTNVRRSDRCGANSKRTETTTMGCYSTSMPPDTT